MNKKFFILLIDDRIDAVADDWNNLRDYVSETEKHGSVYEVTTHIPFGADMSQVSTTHKLFGTV